MKHLNTYKLFELLSHPDIWFKQDIREICYDLTDDKGFSVRISDTVTSDSKSVWIKSIEVLIGLEKHPFGYFKIDDVLLNVLLRILDYAGSDLYNISILRGDKWKMYYTDMEDVQPWRFKHKNYEIYNMSDLPKLIGDTCESISILIKKTVD